MIIFGKEFISGGRNHPKIFPILKISNTREAGEHSARLSRFTKRLDRGYEQLAGSRYASTKRAEIEVLSCVCVYHVYKDFRQRLVESIDSLLTAHQRAYQVRCFRDQ